MTHYIPEDIDCKIGDLMQQGKLPGPMFVGQGLSKRVGSDCYGYYVTELKKTATGKPLVGIVNADSKFETSWTDGNMTCAMPADKTPTLWITTYGHCKRNKKLPKWYACDKTGKRFPGRVVWFDWNGAYAYLDPSF